MTAFADAYLNAKPKTRVQKRNFHPTPKKGLPRPSQEQIAQIHATALLIDVSRSLPKDLGFDEPMCKQARPNTNLSRPSYPRITTQAFAKSYDFSLISKPLLKALDDQDFSAHANSEPTSPQPIPHVTTRKLTQDLGATVIAAADAARLSAIAENETEGTIAYFTRIMT